MPLQFSRNLDTYNPNTPEWREDVGLVVTWLLAKVPPSHQCHGCPRCVRLRKAGGPWGKAGRVWLLHSPGGLASSLVGVLRS